MPRRVRVDAEREPDGTWVAEVVADTDIRSVGGSLDELELNLREVLALWRGGVPDDYEIEGLPSHVANR